MNIIILLGFWQIIRFIVICTFLYLLATKGIPLYAICFLLLFRLFFQLVCRLIVRLIRIGLYVLVFWLLAQLFQ